MADRKYNAFMIAWKRADLTIDDAQIFDPIAAYPDEAALEQIAVHSGKERHRANYIWGLCLGLKLAPLSDKRNDEIVAGYRSAKGDKTPSHNPFFIAINWVKGWAAKIPDDDFISVYDTDQPYGLTHLEVSKAVLGGSWIEERAASREGGVSDWSCSWA